MASHLLGYSKPDPRVFRAALEKIGATPTETLFVDDKAVNVNTAKALGIEAFEATGARDVILGLQQFGIIGKEVSDQAINSGR